MADKSLEVKITADVTSLQAQSAVAKVELSALNSTVKTLATAFVEASDDMKASLAPQLDVAVEKAVAAKAELASLNAEIKELAHPEATGFLSQLSVGMTEATEKVEGLTTRMTAFSRLTGSLMEFAMAGLAVEQVGEAINHVAETGEQLNKLSEETGLSTEQLSALRVMAIGTGTDFDQFTKLLQRLPGTLQSAASGSGRAAEAFAAMHISVTDSTTGALRPMGDILDEVSAKLASYADGTDKTALETDIFGAKIGASLLPMLNQLGEVGLAGAIVQSNNLNQTWTGPSAEAAQQYCDDMARAKLAVEGITDSIVRGLLPALDWMAKGLAPTLDAQITAVQTAIAKGGEGVHGGAELPALKQQLADLEAQKKALDDSMAKQSATAGGAAPGSAPAPTIAPKGGGDAAWSKETTAALDQENEKIEQNATSTKQANAEKLQNSVQYWQGVLQAGNLTATEEAAAQSKLVSAETAERANQLSAGTAAVKSAAAEQTQIATDAANARKAIATSEYDAQKSNWESEVAQGKMTKAQEVQDEINAENQMYAAALEEAEKEAELAPAGTAAKAKALDAIEVLQAQHVATMAGLNTTLVDAQIAQAKTLADAQKAAADATSAAWQRAFAPVTQAFDTSLNGIIQGTQTLQQAELRAAQSISLAFIDAEFKKVEAFAVGELQIVAGAVRSELSMTAAAQAGNMTRLSLKSTADASGKAVDAATSTATINNNAHTAFTGAYSAVAGIPYVGPVLAPIAGATAYAAVMAMDVLSAAGGLSIGAGENPLVQLHENETVLPAHIAKPLTAMLAGGNTSNNNSIGDTNVTNHFNMTANGGSNGLQPSDLLSMLNTAVRSGSLQSYPALARAMRRGN